MILVYTFWYTAAQLLAGDDAYSLYIFQSTKLDRYRAQPWIRKVNDWRLSAGFRMRNYSPLLFCLSSVLIVSLDLLLLCVPKKIKMDDYILAWLPAFINSSINRQIFFDRIKYTRWVESLFNSKRPSRIEDCTNEINETTEKQISSCFSRIYFITRPYYYYSPLHFSASRYSLCLFVLFTPPPPTTPPM
jgi:hypothetical protein